MNDDSIGPIISVFTPNPGPPVARGVLISGKDGFSGLFSAWPESLVGEKFGIYIPGAERGKGQWLDPDEVAVLRGDESGRTFGVVSFVEDPIGAFGLASVAKYHEVAAQPNASNWDAVKASLANNLETLDKLEPILPHERLIPEATAMPKGSFPLNVAYINPGDFICHHLLHLD